MHPLGLAVVLSLSLAQATADSTAAWKQIDAEGQQIGAAIRKRDMNALQTILPTAKVHLVDFAAKFPSDPHAGEARLYGAQMGILERQVEFPKAPTEKDTVAEFGQIAADTSLSGKVRMVAAEKQIMQMLEMAYESKNAADWNAAEAKTDLFGQTFGGLPQGDPVPGVAQTPVIVEVRQAELSAEKASGDQARYDALLAKLSKDPQPDVVALVVKARAEEKDLADLKSKPLNLSFKAVDGSTVDLATMRGKVVLIDFWATWCGPCREEVPNVVAAYQKYHDKGFEIVGVSLDQDKAAMDKYVAENGMTWPQYFDGKGWQNDISSRFGIDSIPAMWIVGKNGILVTKDGRDDLDGQIAKLLSAK